MAGQEPDSISTPTPTPAPTPAPEPKVHLRVLIISGESHVFSFGPETTVGRMKELIWIMWPSEWTAPAQPPAPSWIRVLYAGRVLGDESTLAGNNMPVGNSAVPTVIHLAVRSFSIKGSEGDTKKALQRRNSSEARAEEDVGSGCCCIVQ